MYLFLSYLFSPTICDKISLSQNALINKKNKKIGNVRSSTGLGGENRRYTKEERGYFGVSSRETLAMASGIPLGGGKNVGEKALDYVKQIYENSKEAEYERIALEEEAKKTVKDTYNEIKEQGLKENKFDN